MQNHLVAAFVCVLPLVSLPGTPGFAQEKPAAAAPAAKDGTVTGRIVYDGKAPELPPLEITSDKSKSCCPEGQTVSVTDPSLLIDAKGGIANCVITVQVEDAKVEPLKEPLTIDQHGCHFDPHVIVVPVGSKVVFTNSDQCTHNVHTLSARIDPVNGAIGNGGKLELACSQRDRVQVRCDYHPWMSCYVVVTDTPFWSLTKADGSFEIRGLKPGPYKAEVWHERLGKQKFDLVVGTDGCAHVPDVKLALKKKS